MPQPALRFVDSPYHANTQENLLAEFRETGFVVLPDVFERDSVDAFRAEVVGLIDRRDKRMALADDAPHRVWPVRAPRIRNVIRGALSPDEMFPVPSLFEDAWLISPAVEPGVKTGGWHKDRSHRGMPGNEYHYPLNVHLAVYFDDMSPAHGPTAAIPRSHRDPSLSPQAGSKTQLFLPRKQDVVLWDQRCWHSATGRTIPGERILAIFGFYPTPVFGASGLPRLMSASQRAAWMEAESPEDQIYFGGAFARDGAKQTQKFA